MAMIEMKIMIDHSLSLRYGAKINAFVSNPSGLRQIARTATISAKERAYAACQVIQEKWQEQ